MPLSKISLRPGVNKEQTSYSGEGGWFETNWVRFRSGMPEKIGGWIRNGTDTFKGVCRAMWNWTTLTNDNLLGIGTNQKYYVERGGSYHDITPWAASAQNLGTNPFATVSGSRKVVVTHTSHGASKGTFVTFASASVFNSVTMNGEFEIVELIDANTYTVSALTTATGTGSGGGSTPATARYTIGAGNLVSTLGRGWSIGVWGSGSWGFTSSTASSQTSQLRLWTNDNYGQDLVFAVRGGPIYYWAVDTSTWARAVTLTSLADAYVPKQVLELKTSDIQRFAIAIGANPYVPGDSGASAFDPMLVRWSDQENIYDWKASDINQAGELRLSHGSTLVTALTTRQEILVWSDSALYSMQYLGPPYVWGFNILLDNISIISPNAKASAASVVYWMGSDKFYSYSGRVETLPCTLRTYVFDDLNREQAYQICCGTNEGFSEVWWFYPSANSFINDKYVVYNYLDRTWYHGGINRTSWLDSALRSFPMGAFSMQNTYLSAAITSSTTLVTFTTVNGVSYPLSGTVTIDSEDITYTGLTGSTFTGCTRGANGTTAAAHTEYAAITYKVANQIAFHEYGCDDQSGLNPVAIDAYVESSDFDIGDGHNFGFVWRVLPDLTFAGSTAANPTVNLVIEPRQNSGSAYSAYETPTVTRSATYPVEQYTGQVNTRLRGRQMKMRVESNTVGTTFQLGTPRIDIRQAGRKS